MERLAARVDRRGILLRLGRTEDEFHIFGGLERFTAVEGLFGELWTSSMNVNLKRDRLGGR